MKRRVVVTGIGVVSALGIGVDAFCPALFSATVGLRRIERFDASGFPCQIAGEVAPFKTADFLPISYRKAAKLMARDIQLATVAAHQAFVSAQLSASSLEDPADERFSCHVGAGLISIDLDELTAAMSGATRGNSLDLERWGNGGMDRLTPLWLLKYLPNMVASHLTIIHRLAGASNTITASEASGHLAIGEAFRTIQRGDADRALCGGVESKVNPLGLARQLLLKRLATDANDAPASAVRPFAAAASGTVLGEGGILLVLEELETAQARRAPIYAELLGFGASQDTHLPANLRQAMPSYRLALQSALRDSQLEANQIDLLVPCGLGCREQDRAELVELDALFGARMARLPLATTRPQIGNLAAGNAIDAAAAILALDQQCIPPALNSERQTGEFILNVAPHARLAKLKTSICCTHSLTGQNAALIFRRFKED
jgi:3-oxoacyl-[acyl-carrier-protein] synthase II